MQLIAFVLCKQVINKNYKNNLKINKNEVKVEKRNIFIAFI